MGTRESPHTSDSGGVVALPALVARDSRAVVEDYFRINAGWSNLMAKAVEHPAGDTKAQSPGSGGTTSCATCRCRRY